MLIDRIVRFSKRLHIRMLGLDGTERFIPKIQGNVPWAAMHFERYRFASRFITDHDSVTDLACGVGYGSEILSQKAARVHGYDISAPAIRYARNNYPGIFQQADLFAVSAQTDVVVSFETIEHIPSALETTVNHLVSLTKRALVASVPYMEPHGNNPFHHHFLLTEDHFEFLRHQGRVRFFYQEPEPGFRIHELKVENPQNLIVVFER